MDDDNDNDNDDDDDDTHPPRIIVRVGMVFRRGQKESNKVSLHSFTYERERTNVSRHFSTFLADSDKKGTSEESARI